MLQYLIQEFEHEVNNTRKFLTAIPEKDLNYKPSPISWTMGELAHILLPSITGMLAPSLKMFMIWPQTSLIVLKPVTSKLP